jgi:serine protease
VGQWYLRAPAAPAVSAIDAVGAWQQVSASPSVVVAVLDTGVLASHPDLAGRVLSGYDTIADTAIANDGSGRDGDANDPGDWVTAAESNNRSGPFFECGASDSSWHGTQVSGLIGAIANNGQGIAGAAHGVRILPVRVLGKCGGYDSDILAGMYWAGGVRQAGLPVNPTPARVLNMSLGGTGSCSAAYAEAVRTLNAQGVVIVAAAGNSVGLAVGTPANCPGVIGVAGLRHVGSKVGFSDLGPEIAISAPGGNCVNIGANEPCLYPIATTADEGLRGPQRPIYTDSFNYTVGTSFAAPLVSATVALMLSADPSLAPAEVRRRLQLAARPFPVRGADNGTDPTPVPVCRPPNGEEQLQCYCTTGLCGTGMLDAAAAVRTVLAPDAPDERARQLLNAAERLYPQYFPDRPQTQASAPFLYRYHPTTGVYLGVVVTAGAGFVQEGVYAMGGPFGATPLYLGQLRDFITPGVLAGVR